MGFWGLRDWVIRNIERLRDFGDRIRGLEDWGDQGIGVEIRGWIGLCKGLEL